MIMFRVIYYHNRGKQIYKERVMKTFDVVLIGGGVIGTSILYYLAKGGCKNSVLLEKGLLASESTGKSAGGFRQQFSTAINIQMSKLSTEVFRTFNDEMEQDTLFNHRGYIFLANTNQQFELMKKNVVLQKSLGVNVELINHDQLKELVPDIYLDDIVGATYCPDDGFTDPYEVAQGYARGARRLGAQIKEQTEVLEIKVNKDKTFEIITNKETYSTPMIINSAGPWAGLIAQMVGLDVPILPYRRQIFVSGSFKPFKDRKYIMPMVVDPSAVYMRSEGDCILMGYTDKEEPTSFNQNVDWDFLEKMVVPAMQRIPIFEDLEINTGWAGLYDTTPDHHAILGHVPELEGFIMAAGFSGHGFMHSPAVGITLAELILQKPQTVDISQLSINRFANSGKGLVEAAVI